MMHTLDGDLALALRLADAAASRSLSYFRRELRQWSKGDGSLATEADLAVEDELRRLLGIERPGDAVLFSPGFASFDDWVAELATRLDIIDSQLESGRGDAVRHDRREDPHALEPMHRH